jgi:hypothetical protein
MAHLVRGFVRFSPSGAPHRGIGGGKNKKQQKIDHHPNVYFRLHNVVTIGLNTSLRPRHPLEKNPGQSQLFEGSSNAIDRR